MTVSSSSSRISYTGNGSTTAFAFPYEFDAGSDLKVYQAGTLKTITTHYTVSGGSGSSGTVTFVTAPANGDSVVIYDDPPATQLLDYIPNDPFPAESHEGGLDKLTRLVRRLKDRIDRAMRLSDSDVSGASTILPTPSAQKVLGWNAAANALVNYSASDLTTVAAFSAWQSQRFSGDGATVAFTLSSDPGNVNNMDVSIGGVTQQNGVDFTVSGVTLTFTTAPVTGTNNIFVRWGQALPQGITLASAVNFTPAGTGAVVRTTESKLREFVSVKDFGAACDGVTNDAAAVQLAITHCLTNEKDLIVDGMCLIASSLNIDRQVDGAAYDHYFTIAGESGGGFRVASDTVMFSTTLVNGSDPASQLVRFKGLKFEADVNTRVAYVLDQNKFLRVLFESCNFRKIKLLSAPAGRLTQSITLQNCQARRWSGTFFSSKEVTFDLKVLGGLWEAGGDAFDLDYPVGVAFQGVNIEGMSVFAIKYIGGYGLSVHGCYFEDNGGNDANGCSIDGSAGTGADGSEAVSILGNYFSGDGDTPAKPQVKWGDCVTGMSSGNLCTTTLHNFVAGSRVTVLNDYGRTALANTNPKMWLRTADQFLYGGTITQSFVGGRGGFLKLRSLQNNVESTNGLDVNENGDIEVGGSLFFGATFDAALQRKAANVLGPAAGDSFRVGGIAGETLEYNAATANAAVATTLGSVGPTGSTAGNPQGWLRVNVAGTDRFVPFW